MSQELQDAMNACVAKREQMVAHAKATRPTAKFYVDLVATSRAIDRASAVDHNSPAHVSDAVKELRELSRESK